MSKVVVKLELQMNRFKKFPLLFCAIVLPFIVGSSNRVSPEDNFTLSNYTTFVPGSEVTINLYLYNGINQNPPEFSFKLLKITDPIKFYSELNSSYGVDIIGKQRDILLKYTEKVKEWNSIITGRQTYGKGNVSVGKIEEPGIYIIQAMREGLVGYCIVAVTNKAIVYKNSPNQILAFLTDVRTSEFIKEVKFTLVNNKKVISSFTDKEGLVLFKYETGDNPDFENHPLLAAQSGKETIISNPYLYFGNQKEIAAYIYTNQPIYRPGQVIFFKGIFREEEGNELKNIAGTEFTVTVKSPKNKEVYSGILKTSEIGSISGSFKLGEDADLGSYSILISKEESTYYGSFEVQEYKKPEFLVKVELPKSSYANKDEINGKVKADYYFGSPVTNGAVTLKIYKKNFWRPWWFWSDYSWFYRTYEKIGPVNYREMQFVKQLDGTLNSKGEYDFSFKATEEPYLDYVYVITAEITDASRNIVTGSSEVNITRGDFSIFTTPDKYFTEKGHPVILKINAADFADKPVVTDYKVFISYPEDSKQRNLRKGIIDKDSLSGRTDISGKSAVNFLPKDLKTGYYNYVVTAKDDKGREITSQSTFYYGEPAYYYNDGEGVEIVTDKDAYEKGDSLTAYIFLPSGKTDLLLTYESKEIFYYKKITAKEKSFVFKEKLDDRFAPSFNISVVFIKDGKFYNNSKQIGVLARDKFLNISIVPDKKQFKPADSASYELLVKDFKGNSVKNTELSFGVVDESIYSIKEDQSLDLKSFFYAPKYSYIPAANSYFYMQSYGSSRPVMAFDKNTDQGLLEKKGNGRLFGKILNKEKKVVPGLKLILNSDENYYVTEIDTAGNYEFLKIKTGQYCFYYVNNQNVITLIDKVVVDNNKKFNAAVVYPIEQLIHNTRENVNQVQAGRINGMPMALADKSVLKLEASTSGGMATGYKDAVVRSNFEDEACWVPNIKTNENGIALVKFKMPDNLTTWRISVKGITSNTEVGEEVNKTITRKDLLIRMEPPRFFREGDEITISTIVHNYLNDKKKTKITFDTKNLTLISSKINTPGYSDKIYNEKEGLYELTIEKNTELRIDWVVKVDIPSGEAKLTAKALTNSESDAMELKVPIIPKGMKEIKSVTAQLSDRNEEDLKFNLPEDVDLRSTKFSFTVSPSLAGTMLKALDDLAGYPYGCVEQTMSRFLPTIIAAKTFKELKAPLKSKTITELPNMVDAGLQRLYNFQHQDGGWGWWTNDNTHPYMTAYVIYGMNLTQQAGYNIDREIYNKGLENLYNQLNSTTELDLTTEAFMIYALSSSQDQKNNALIFNKIKTMEPSKLNSYALSLNIISLMNLKANLLAEEYVKLLEERATNNGGMEFWSGKEWHYNWQDDNVQTTAFAVKALIKTGVQSEIISKAVNWLMKQKEGYSWRSTQQTASVIFALSDYLKTTNELNPDYSYVVYLNGIKVDSKIVGAANVYIQPSEVNVDGAKDNNLIKGENNIRIEKEGTGRLYFSGINLYYTQNSDNTDTSNFSVRREYYMLSPEEKDGRIIYTKTFVNGEIKSGDEIFVKTFVNTKTDNLQYFILEDMLPSGFETIKDESKYEIEGENNVRVHPIGTRNGFNPWRWFYADKEYRDQKVSYFVTNVNKEMVFTYLMRAQIPGKVTVSPAQAYLMYYPEFNGNSRRVEFNVKDK